MDTYSSILYTGYFHQWIPRNEIKTAGEIALAKKVRVKAEEEKDKIADSEIVEKRIKRIDLEDILI